MDYWKSKVAPKIKKIFEKSGTKKAAAAELCKTFEDSKEEYGKDFEEKKTELQPRVVEIYEASSTEIKALVKDPKDTGLKKNSAAIHKFLDELAKSDFPGSKAVSEACSKVGAAYLSAPVFFVFEKVSSLLPEEKKEEAVATEEDTKKNGEAEPPAAEPAAVEPPKPEEKTAEAAAKA
ncbi:PREDICTED: plasma membrane-associated cation-binding protein 1 [Ipomoea nil]|uniref:plasma membrane-associated cation-binding protein 1 n=1 Tax=Ipomoea nil TaxID=35883 RepID=UPI000901B354|nr:PREDICTED: plasma membrane-associated cation-binding protein 1 [Ipomoea nil]